MTTKRSVWLAALATFALAGSHSAQAQQQVQAVSVQNCQQCQQCQNGTACNDPGCCLCRVRLYPDAGWNPPVNMPVNYNWAWYGLAGPQAPYGSPNGGFIAQYPSVYQPTDTTQLGYYYHKVPTWQPQPGRLPGVPVPEMFHNRSCPVNCYGGHWHGVEYAATVPQSPEAALKVVPALVDDSDSRRKLDAAGVASTKAIRSVSSTPEPVLEKPAQKKPLVAAPKPAAAAKTEAAVKPETKTAARPVSKTSPATGTATKAASKPAAQPAVKPATKPAAKSAKGSQSLLKSLFD